MRMGGCWWAGGGGTLNSWVKRAARVASRGGGGVAVGGRRRTTLRVLFFTPKSSLIDLACERVGLVGLEGPLELVGNIPSTGRWRTILFARSDPVRRRRLSALRPRSDSKEERGLADADFGKKRILDFGRRTMVSTSSGGATVASDLADEPRCESVSVSTEDRRLTSTARPCPSRSTWSPEEVGRHASTGIYTSVRRCIGSDGQSRFVFRKDGNWCQRRRVSDTRLSHIEGISQVENHWV